MSIQPKSRSFAMGTTALSRPGTALSAIAALVAVPTAAHAIDPNTLPQGGNVVGGAATVSQSGARLDVNQSSDRAVIDWRSFDIGSDAHVNFAQPGSSSIAVNRVNASTDPTQINGRLTANGNVWVLNPNGVMFGASARVDVSGLVASTGNINVSKFMSGSNRIDFTSGGGGAVINDGDITIREGGLAAFVAPHVRNNGIIRARLGKVTLAAGEEFTIDLAGDQLIELGLGAEGARAEQLGQVVAEGGIIDISAKAAGAIIDSVVNVSGITSAASATVVGGEIILGGDDVTIAGALDASGATGGGAISISGDTITTTSTASLSADATTTGNGGTIIAYADDTGTYNGTFTAKGGATSGDGGFVETSGKTVRIDDGITVITLAPNGQAGNWTIDPDDLTVIAGADGGPIDPSASTVTNATIVNQMATTGVTLAANNSITVDAEIDSSAQGTGTTLALNDQDNNNDLTINLNADISLGASQTLTGQGTTVNVANGVDIQDGVDVAANNATVNVAAGNYAAGTTVTKTGLTIDGASAARVTVANGQTGFTVNGDNTTVSGFEIVGPIAGLGAFTTIDWGDAAFSSSTGITVNASGVTISGNNIHDIRTGVSFVSGSSATATGNVFDNTKGSFIVRSDNITMTGNTIGSTGNEWDIVFLNGVTAAGYTADPTTDEVQYGVDIMALSSGNGGMRVLDRRYGSNGFITATAGGNRSHIEVNAGSSFNAADDFALGNGLGNQRQPLGSINDGIEAVVHGGFVNVQDGTYAENVVIDKALTLAGQSQTGTIIDWRAGSGYGISVSADDVTIQDLTLYGATADAGNSYGIKVSPNGPDASARLNNFTLTNVTSRGAGRAEVDLNGVNGAVLTNVTADGRTVDDDNVTTAGAGIQIGDSANVTLTGVTTLGNDWGGVALFQNNTYYDQQSTNINIDASLNSFNEWIGLYAEDESALHDFGTLNLAGFSHVVANPDHRADGDEFTFFQETLQGALDFAVNLVNPGSSAVAGWDGTDVTDQFFVGVGNLFGGGTQAMSIQTAITAADDGDTVNVLAGNFAAGNTVNKTGLTVQGSAGAVINVANTQTGFTVTADDVTISGLEFIGPVVGDWRNVDWTDPSVSSSMAINIGGGRSGIVVTNNNIHDIRSGINVSNGSDATITNNRIENTKGAVLLRPGQISELSGNSEGPLGNEWGVVLNLSNIDNSGTLTADLARQAELLGLSTSNGGWTVLDRGFAFANRTHIFVDDDSTVSPAEDFAIGNGLGNERQALPNFQAALDGLVTGGFVNVADGNYSENVVSNRQANFIFGNVSVDGLTLNGAGTTVSGTLGSSVNGFNFAAPILLSGSTSFTTTGGAAFNAASINGTTAGGQTLVVNTAGAANVGSLGNTTRLGATTLTGAGQKVLTGANYNANSLTFGSDVRLTQVLTTFNTTISNAAAGAITFLGNLFGTANGGQSVSFSAGNGLGAASSNGDVTLQNAGTAGVLLGSMTANGDDFEADTVRLAGAFTSQLTGDQTFSTETLYANGGVNSSVGGNANGPIVTNAPVTVNSGGSINGNISGSTVVLNGQSVSGNINASQSGTINAQTVNANLSGGSFAVNAQGGSVTGSPASLSTAGSGTLSVNGQNVIGTSNADANQIVVEGFTLPQGAFISESGEIVLPQGLTLGLISPAAGPEGGLETKVVLVRSVQRLGQLLSEGYTAIVIDLNSGFSDEEQELALAQ
ncbi:hypothetical protein GCM10011587_05570 [Pyruvatibacter mobilis]|nr:hypothetical protein GCM10011587_05570 [Pyruvatibacter mobilis]